MVSPIKDSSWRKYQDGKAAVTNALCRARSATALQAGDRVPPIGYGRGDGVGRDRGSGVCLGAGVARGVGVGVAVAVAVAVAVGVGVCVGVGVALPPGAQIATIMGEPVLKKPTVALDACGG